MHWWRTWWRNITSSVRSIFMEHDRQYTPQYQIFNIRRSPPHYCTVAAALEHELFSRGNYVRSVYACYRMYVSSLDDSRDSHESIITPFRSWVMTHELDRPWAWHWGTKPSSSTTLMPIMAVTAMLRGVLLQAWDGVIAIIATIANVCLQKL